ncbi:Uroporphyrinogen decarboxylase [Moorella thermoacetica]|uniref:methylcobamide:CoM methyltransferase MtbA n=1 Tax=Neomoorella thermoacetica TaxID=1525 RepID=UPI0030D0B6A3
MLTPRERLKRSLAGAAVDRPPCICPGGMMNFVVEEIMTLTGSAWPEAHQDPVCMADLAAGLYERGGFENTGVPFCMTVEAEAMGATVDLGTPVVEPRITAYPLASVTEWTDLGGIDTTRGRARVVIEAIKILKRKHPEVPVIANLVGPVSLASSLVDPQVFYKELRKRPAEAHALMEFVTANLIAFGRAQLEAGADVLAIADPGGTGEILGPPMFRAFALPYLNKIIGALRDQVPLGTIIHICGRLRSIFQELNNLASDALSFDAITSARQVAENVPGKVLMGNVSTFVLAVGTPAKVKAVARQSLHSGIAILAPACGLGTRTPLANIQALVAAAKAATTGVNYNFDPVLAVEGPFTGVDALQNAIFGGKAR